MVSAHCNRTYEMLVPPYSVLYLSPHSWASGLLCRLGRWHSSYDRSPSIPWSIEYSHSSTQRPALNAKLSTSPIRTQAMWLEPRLARMAAEWTQLTRSCRFKLGGLRMWSTIQRGVPGTLTTFFYYVFPFMQHVPTGPNLLAAVREHDRMLKHPLAESNRFTLRGSSTSCGNALLPNCLDIQSHPGF